MVDRDCRQFACKGCGSQFTHHRALIGRPPDFCQICRLDRATKPRPRYSKICAGCAVPFVALVDWAVCCSRKCGKLRRRRLNPEKARQDQKTHKMREMQTERYRRVLALSELRRVLHRVVKKKKAEELKATREAWAAKKCATCGKDVGLCVKGPRKYCSRTCRDSGVVTRAIRRKSASSHRCAKRAQTVERFDPFDVFERDGWRCQICGVGTPKSLRGKHKPRSPELDHVVPLSRNGEHSMANTQCACRRCNRAKSNKRILGQMGLFSLHIGNGQRTNDSAEGIRRAVAEGAG